MRCPRRSTGISIASLRGQFVVLFALPGLAFYALRINAILAFWAVDVMTRPLGASFADWTGKSRSAGGLGIGDGLVAAVLAVLIVAGVAYLTASRSDQVETIGLKPVLADEAA